MKEITKEELDRALKAKREKKLRESQAKWEKNTAEGLKRVKKNKWRKEWQKGVES